MRHIIKRVVLLFILLLSSEIRGESLYYQMFDNIGLENKFSSAYCFIQDSQGLLWIGTENGLFCYDGYNVQQHFTLGTLSNTHIYSAATVDNAHLYLGSDNGVLIYNTLTDAYEKTPVRLPVNVRALSKDGHTLWIGTLNGLYMYDLISHKLKRFDAKHTKGLPNSTVYSLVQTNGGDLYIGTYNGLCYYSKTKNAFIRVPITQTGCNNVFVNSLFDDNIRNCIWIGTEGELFKYDKRSHLVSSISSLSGNTIKSLALDDGGRLLIGTDNGMFTYKEHLPLQHVVHDARDVQSLMNDIVWNIFVDKSHNVWVGTDNGVSLFRYNPSFQYFPLPVVTGSGHGNHLYCVFKDSHGYLWLGGTDGLLRINNFLDTKPTVRWYRVEDVVSPLPHNRIRYIYEDSNHNLWIASDGGVNRYDYVSERFIRYNIIDKSHTLNSNWAYYIKEDCHGYLWIATCLGGIFVVNKDKLVANGNNAYIADYNISNKDGLKSMFVNQVVSDNQNNMWALLYNSGVDEIDIRTHKINHFSFGGVRPNYVINGRYGNIWVGHSGGVLRILPKRNEINKISFHDNNDILSMLDVEGKMWISTSDGMWVIDEQSLAVHKVNISDRRFTSLYYDSTTRRIYMGGTDGFGVLNPKSLTLYDINNPIILTAISVNGQPLKTKESIRHLKEVELSYKQNNLSVEFSDLPYSIEEKNRFIYQLDGVDKDWITLKSNVNKITYNNLIPGKYVLRICKLGNDGKPTNVICRLKIHIDSPWYYGVIAKIIYLLLLIGLIVWIINFIRIRTRLNMERAEKERVLEQVRLKIDFYNKLDKARNNVVELNRLINQVAGPVNDEETTGKIKVKSYDEKLLDDTTKIIEDRISDSDLNVNALCEQQGISNKQLYRKIKQLTGMTPVEYIKSIRMKRAAQLLSQKKFTVAEVMYMVGFSNHSYFSKCFQTEYGKTPRQFMEDV